MMLAGVLIIYLPVTGSTAGFVTAVTLLGAAIVIGSVAVTVRKETG